MRNVLDTSWVNNVEITEQFKGEVFDLDKTLPEKILNGVLFELTPRLSRTDWRNIRRFGGVWIENLEYTVNDRDMVCGTHYTIEVSCDVKLLTPNPVRYNVRQVFYKSSRL